MVSMETRIGEVFREARRRREIDLAEVEAATRIRPRYLRAMEAEEWDVLPGDVYTRAFIRTYASFLGLDGERLAEDYREGVEGASREWEAPAEPPSAVPSGPAGRRPRFSLGWLAIPAMLALAVLVIVAIPGGSGGGGGGGNATEGAPSKQQSGADGGGSGLQGHPAPHRGVSVRLAASAEVWVCVLDDRGRRLVNGQILEEGAEEGPFRSGSFTVSFGNGEISMLVDGQEAEIPATSSPIGYSIDASGKLIELSESERPTCT
jgi:hypothetical protein